MSPAKVLSQKDVEQHLADRGFVPTEDKTSTATAWVNASTGRHLLVPFSLQGYYPDWMLYDLLSHVGEIIPSVPAVKVKRQLSNVPAANTRKNQPKAPRS